MHSLDATVQKIGTMKEKREQQEARAKSETRRMETPSKSRFRCLSSRINVDIIFKAEMIE